MVDVKAEIRAKVLRNQFSMAVVDSPLRAKETARPGDRSEAPSQHVTSACQKIPIAVSPILAIHKHIPQLDERSISKACPGEHLFDALVRCLCFRPNAHARPVGSQSDIDDGLYLVLAQSPDEVVRGSTTVSDGVDFPFHWIAL